MLILIIINNQLTRLITNTITCIKILLRVERIVPVQLCTVSFAPLQDMDIYCRVPARWSLQQTHPGLRAATRHLIALATNGLIHVKPDYFSHNDLQKNNFKIKTNLTFDPLFTKIG